MLATIMIIADGSESLAGEADSPEAAAAFPLACPQALQADLCPAAKTSIGGSITLQCSIAFSAASHRLRP